MPPPLARSRRGPAWRPSCWPAARRRRRRPAPARPRRARPALQVAVVADGLDHPWDVAQAPDGTLLFDERAGGFTAVLPDGTVRDGRGRLRRPLRPRGDRADGAGPRPGLRGQPALLHLPGAHRRRRRRSPSSPGPSPPTGAAPPASPTRCSAASRSTQAVGRHGGCRLRFDPHGALLVGTGDNAVGSNPQDRHSLAGKVLRSTAPAGQPATVVGRSGATLHVRAPQRAGPGRAAGHGSRSSPSSRAPSGTTR